MEGLLILILIVILVVVSVSGVVMRRRLRELEDRVAALEAATPVDYTMPPRPTVDIDPVEAHTMWRERCADYGQVVMEDVPDDRFGVYL